MSGQRGSAPREVCIAATCRAIGLLGSDLEEASKCAREGAEASRALGFAWAEGLASSFDGIVDALQGDTETAAEKSEHALAIQWRLGDHEGAGVSSVLSPNSRRAVTTSSTRSICTVRRSQAFEAIGDRAEKRASCRKWRGRISGSKTPQPHAGTSSSPFGHTPSSASIRGVGLSLIGLAAAAAVDHRPDAAVRIAAAAEIYASEEGIVNVYGDNPVGRELIDRARARWPRRMSSARPRPAEGSPFAETLEMARPGDPAPA